MPAIKFDIYQHVTDRIVAAIESGNAGTWRMPWHFQAPDSVRGFAMRPCNVAGRPYRGINVPLLLSEKMSKGYNSDVWGTYKAWQAAGANVRKGEKGTVIVFWKQLTVTDENDETKTKKIMMARGYSVFNSDQVENWQPKAKPAKVRTVADRIEHAETFFAAIPVKVEHGGNRAFYSPTFDQIGMPKFEQFKTPTDYYSTRGHETTHATGHASRCDREFGKRFGDNAYAFEELVAELGAAYLCAHLELANEPRADHAAYVNNWLKVLKGDKKAIFTAASQAQKAIDWVIEAAGEAAGGAEDDDAAELEMAA